MPAPLRPWSTRVQSPRVAAERPRGEQPAGARLSQQILYNAWPHAGSCAARCLSQGGLGADILPPDTPINDRIELL